MTDFFYPKLRWVRVLAPYRLQTAWNTGEILEVDVEPALRKVPALNQLLDVNLFARAHLDASGNSVSWLDCEFGADNLYAWAREQSGDVSHQMFDGWMRNNGLSLATAAEALGISRRLVSDYRTAQKSIPRVIWLACLGFEATRPECGSLPRCLPAAKG